MGIEEKQHSLLTYFTEHNLQYKDKGMLKGVEKRKMNLEAKIKELTFDIENRKDDVVDFKLMGIDHLLVDESHYQNFYEFPKFRIKLLILILLHFNIVRIIY